MVFIVKGKSQNHDRILRVHADTPEQAEAIGWKRGLFVTEVTPIKSTDPSLSKFDLVADLLWRMWRHTPASRMKCFGRSVSKGQAAALIVLGFTTWGLDLHAFKFVTF